MIATIPGYDRTRLRRSKPLRIPGVLFIGVTSCVPAISATGARPGPSAPLTVALPTVYPPSFDGGPVMVLDAIRGLVAPDPTRAAQSPAPCFRALAAAAGRSLCQCHPGGCGQERIGGSE